MRYKTIPSPPSTHNRHQCTSSHQSTAPAPSSSQSRRHTRAEAIPSRYASTQWAAAYSCSYLFSFHTPHFLYTHPLHVVFGESQFVVSVTGPTGTSRSLQFSGWLDSTVLLPLRCPTVTLPLHANNVALLLPSILSTIVISPRLDVRSTSLLPSTLLVNVMPPTAMTSRCELPSTFPSPPLSTPWPALARSAVPHTNFPVA
jgi:hypothetical protein